MNLSFLFPLILGLISKFVCAKNNFFFFSFWNWRSDSVGHIKRRRVFGGIGALLIYSHDFRWLHYLSVNVRQASAAELKAFNAYTLGLFFAPYLCKCTHYRALSPMYILKGVSRFVNPNVITGFHKFVPDTQEFLSFSYLFLFLTYWPTFILYLLYCSFHIFTLIGLQVE